MEELRQCVELAVHGLPIPTGTLAAVTVAQSEERAARGSVTAKHFNTAPTYGYVALRADDWLRECVGRYLRAVRPAVIRAAQRTDACGADGWPVGSGGGAPHQPGRWVGGRAT